VDCACLCPVTGRTWQSVVTDICLEFYCINYYFCEMWKWGIVLSSLLTSCRTQRSIHVLTVTWLIRVCGLCAVAVRVSSDVHCIYVLQDVSCKLGRTFLMQTGQPLQINEYFLSSWFRHSYQWNTQETRAICGTCVPQSVQRSSWSKAEICERVPSWDACWGNRLHSRVV
jgi:hypothetical protein